MAKSGQSPDEAMPLREVAGHVRAWIDRLGQIWVEGQLIEIKRRGGWVYLTMRDPLAEVSMTVTATTAVFDAAGPLPEGSTVTVFAKPQFFTKSGRFSLAASELRPVGVGRLLAQLEQRKHALQAEGLFAAARKKRLPFLPRAIGLVTAERSAAEQDVLENVGNRWPGAVVRVRHATMQGPRCAEEVMVALHTLDLQADIDVIIVARGGGSLEDLLPFSDEGLVRAAAACRTPIVSAIGHEVDTPLLDLVADVRASTPTAAAKLVVPDASTEVRTVRELTARLRQATSTRVSRERRWLDDVRSRPVLRNPAAGLDAHRERLIALHERLGVAVTRTVDAERTAVAHEMARVRAMSPKATLERGYAILVDAEGASVTRVAEVEVRQTLGAHLADGHLDLSVTDVHPLESRQENP